MGAPAVVCVFPAQISFYSGLHIYFVVFYNMSYQTEKSARIRVLRDILCMILNKNKTDGGNIMSKSRVWKFHNDVDTDQIIASQYLLLPDIEAMKQYTFESLDPSFAKKAQPGDLIVAGENFGCGSSREQAPSVLKALGIKAVIARSFARIFFRNAINIGLPVIVCKDLYDHVEDGGEAELDLSAGTVTAGGQVYTCTKLPEYMQKILSAGGLIASLNKEEA